MRPSLNTQNMSFTIADIASLFFRPPRCLSICGLQFKNSSAGYWILSTNYSIFFVLSDLSLYSSVAQAIHTQPLILQGNMCASTWKHMRKKNTTFQNINNTSHQSVSSAFDIICYTLYFLCNKMLVPDFNSNTQSNTDKDIHTPTNYMKLALTHFN